MTSKIKIKAGLVEIEFEGSEEYLREELPQLVELLCLFDLQDEADCEESEELAPSDDESKKTFELSTNSIAAKLGASSARDLALAACPHLTFIKGADTFTRKNILAEMQLATNYYKDSHSKNLSNTLKGLMKNGKLMKKSSGNYALHASSKS